MAADTGTLILDVDGNLKPLKGKLAKMAKSYRMKLDDKAFTQPLGRITGKLGEFDKSLDASNARVVAFGASAGAIFAVQKALTETVKAAINVEKTLADINVILGVSNKSLGQFSDKLFKVAANTGQAFQTVAEAATELARQGLSVEQTLKRTSDALILTRLSGMKATESVETLTAAINSFSKSALTSTEIINKMANVDAAFAVSTNDLAEALRRVGSTASDANVSFDQLVAAVTSAQQVTARGGAVIGNSFKTIFTRLQRPKVLQQLEMLGIATKDLAGETKPVIQVLQALAKQYDKLGSSQKSQITELIGGVFQINVVKAALSDLGKEYSIYDRALQTSLGSTDEAIKRNEKLNETLSALINKTFANLQKSAAGVGESLFGPSMRGFLDTVNKALESGDDSKGEDFGNKLGKSIFKGLENVISGPGLMLAFVAITKIIGRLGATTGDAFKTMVMQTKESKNREGFERAVEARLKSQSGLMKDILNNDISVQDAHKVIADGIRTENQELDLQISKVKEISSLLRNSGAVKYSDKTEMLALSSKGKKRKAGGLVPDMQERKLARQGGYTAGLTKTTNIGPGQSVISNTREREKRFPGMRQKAIMPPMGSRAAGAYRQDFMSTHGFDPYAGDGFVPNFRAGRPRTDAYHKRKNAREMRDKTAVGGRYLNEKGEWVTKRKGKGEGPSLSKKDFINTGSSNLKMTFGQLQKQKGAYDFSRKAIGAKFFTGAMNEAADAKDIFSLKLRFEQHKQSLGKLREKGMNWSKWENSVNKTFGATSRGPSNYSVDGVRGGNAVESKFLNNIGKINNKTVGPGYYMSKMLSHKIASTKKFSIKNQEQDGFSLGEMTVVSPYSRKYKNVATGFVPQFASKSDSELKPLIRSRLQSGSVQGFNNERWMGIVNSDPTLRGMYDTIVSSNRSRNASKRAGVASRAATAAAQPKLSTIFLKNLEQPDMKKSAIAGYGFSSKMPNAKRNFQNSFRGRYPKMVKGIGYDMFKSMPGASPASTKKMMSQFNVHALDPAAQGQVSGRVFESFVKAMSKQVRKGRETGREKIDMSRHKLKGRFRGLFTGGAASKLGHFGSEIRYGGITSRKAMQKQGFAGGFVPNFNATMGYGKAAVGRAMETERMMGGDPEFRQFPFPHVADKSSQKDFKSVLRDHPNLAADSRKSKEMQQSMFGAKGHVPNYIAGAALRLGATGLSKGGGLIKRGMSGLGGLLGMGGSGGGGEGGKAGMDATSKLLGISMVAPQVSGMLESFAGEGNKSVKSLSSLTSSFSSGAIAASTMSGKMKGLAIGAVALTGLSDVVGIWTDNSFELNKEVQNLTEQLTQQVNASQRYLTTQEKLTEELAKPQRDQAKITKINEDLVKTMSSLNGELQKELLAARGSTEVRAVLEKSNAELAEKTKQAARLVSLGAAAKKTTMFGAGLGGSNLFGGAKGTATDFANEFSGKGLSKLSNEQKGKLLEGIKDGSADLDGSRKEVAKYFTEVIGLEEDYANQLPHNTAALKLVIEQIKKEAKEENAKIETTKQLLKVTKPYTDEMDRQSKALKRAEIAMGQFNEQLLTLSANVFSQKSFLAKFTGDVEAGRRRVGLSGAKGRLEAMRPFTGERTMMRGNFMLNKAGQQEDTFGKVRSLNAQSAKEVNDVLKKMGKAALNQQTTGGMPVTSGAKRKLADYQMGLGNLASSGMRGENLSGAIDRLNNSFFGGRDQIPPGMTNLKSELVNSDMKSRQELANIAKSSMEQTKILEDQYKTQLKQKDLQEKSQLGGNIDEWQSGGGGMMTQMAKRMDIMRFARRTGNVELGGRMALGLNQNIKQMTGKNTTFGRDLAIRGRELGTRRNLSLAGRAMGGDAGRFLLNQRSGARAGAIASVDGKMKPERGLDGIRQATAASAMQMKSMGPVLTSSFTQALNGVGLTQTLQRLNYTMNSITALQGQMKGRRQIYDYNKGMIQNAATGSRAEGYVPNFAGVMMNDQEKLVRGFREKMAVMGSNQYSSAQKRKAKPKMAHGFNKFRDAILTPGMMAGGYVPNFAARGGGRMGLGNYMSGEFSFEGVDDMFRPRKYRNRRQSGFGGRNARIARAENLKKLMRTRSHLAYQFGTENNMEMLQRMSKGHMGLPGKVSPVEYMNSFNRQYPGGMPHPGARNLNRETALKAERAAAQNWSDSASRSARGTSYYRGQGIQTKTIAQRAGGLGKGIRDWRTSRRVSQGMRSAISAAGSRSRSAAYTRRFYSTNRMQMYKGLQEAVRSGKMSPNKYMEGLKHVSNSVAGGAGPKAPAAAAKGGGFFSKIAGWAGKLGASGIAKGGAKLAGKALSLPVQLAIDGTTLGVGVYGKEKAKSNQRAGRREMSATNSATRTYFNQLDHWKYLVGRGEMTPGEMEQKRKSAHAVWSAARHNATGGYGQSTYAGGYIPNFAGGSSMSGLFGNFSKGAHQQKMRQMMDMQRWGAPGLGHLYKPQFINSAMNTPGFKGDILRGMGGGEHFRSYPKMGSFYANGYVPNFNSSKIIESQQREKAQSGRNDVYTKMINGFGPATFNGSERGREEAIVRSHPNPRNAGMAAEGHIPNFAGLEKNIKTMTDNLGLLNETMSMSGSGGGSASGASGNLSVSMAPMNISINGGGGDGMAQGLTTQLDEFRRMVGETFASMGVSPMTGPPV